MGRTCIVTECKGGYASELKKGKKVSVFLFPFNEPERMKLWMRNIPRKNQNPTKYVGVCERHFQKHFIVTHDSVTRDDGSVLTVERDRKKLTADAYPSIFDKCPSYLSEEPIDTPRKTPAEREAEIQQRDQETFEHFVDVSDVIKDFSDFGKQYERKGGHLLYPWICKFHQINCSSEAAPSTSSDNSNDNQVCYWSFYRINDVQETEPSLLSTIRIFQDMHVKIFTHKVYKIFLRYLKKPMLFSIS